MNKNVETINRKITELKDALSKEMNRSKISRFQEEIEFLTRKLKTYGIGVK